MKRKRSTKDQKKRKKSLLYLTLITSVIYILWRLFFTLPLTYGALSITVGVVLLLCEALTIIETFTHFINTSHVKIPEMPIISSEQFPTVDVLICTHNESVELLYKTLNGCSHLTYPDQTKVAIHLCDDKNREEIKELALKFGAHYHGFEGNEFAKAGNLNHALKSGNCTGELVAVLDADMIPTNDFLMETVPYFLLPKMKKSGYKWQLRTEKEIYEGKPIGFVQTRQSFYNLDTFQRNLYLEDHITNEQDYFYREVNPSRIASGSAAFAGSNVVFDREALDKIKGFATHSITEDLATSIEIASHGYEGLALDKELAHGLSPDDTSSFIKQRRRWSRGSAQSIITQKFFKSNLSLRSKFNYFTAYMYWWTFFRRFVFIICPILFSVFDIKVADTSLLSLLIMWLPCYIFYNHSMKIMSDYTINTILSSIQDTIQFPYMIGSIFFGTLQIPEKNFEVTSKESIKGRNSQFRLVWPFIILLILSLWGIYLSVYRIFIQGHEGSVIVLYWLLYNLLPLINAVVYYYGRELARDSELYNIKTAIICKGERGTFKGTTIGMNENYITFKLHEQIELPEHELIDFTLKANNYEYRFSNLPKKTANDGVYCLAVDFTCLEENQKRIFYQILYDRPHTLNRNIKLTYWSDVRILIMALVTHRKKSREEDPFEDNDQDTNTNDFNDMDVLY
ncbi:glycosyltransferase family 2 protein [Enterococcus hermanniensis]|uniref:Glycosyltransferase 2-like domain-containing protein n=1 Tax=Enterococcus hermanniensis TaxID=249189 RepID=A0A1L8TQK2_9ENTE|nr:cellulose synthase catalytic subunit [Enterococcus hermanniensis]OJG46412.1 hypothetical protein RV04_GL000840 [Enterococcus hermanniensis]